MVVMHIAYARAQIFAFDTQYFTFEKKNILNAETVSMMKIKL